ncbi:MAG: pilus assembly protein [Chloroflexi bacterium]|nr:pilus assembly protein [Chloroflexota bacterium]
MVAIIFLVLIAGIVDFGRALNAWIVISNSAREGARQAAIGASEADVTTAAKTFALVPGLSPDAVVVNITYSSDPPVAGDTVTVEVRADQFQIVTPFVGTALGCSGGGPCYLPIASSTTMRYEGAFVQ